MKGIKGDIKEEQGTERLAGMLKRRNVRFERGAGGRWSSW